MSRVEHLAELSTVSLQGRLPARIIGGYGKEEHNEALSEWRSDLISDNDDIMTKDIMTKDIMTKDSRPLWILWLRT